MTRVLPALAVLLVIGLLICPAPPPKSVVDSDKLLCKILADQPKSRVALIETNFQPRVESEERINGRDCWLLRLEPKHKPWPWKQIWIDKKTSAVLAMRDWSPRDVLRSSSKELLLQAKKSQGDLNPPDAISKYISLCLRPMEIRPDVRYYTDGLHCIRVGIKKTTSSPAGSSVYGCKTGIAAISSDGKTEVIVTGDIPEDYAQDLAQHFLIPRTSSN